MTRGHQIVLSILTILAAQGVAVAVYAAQAEPASPRTHASSTPPGR